MLEVKMTTLFAIAMICLMLTAHGEPAHSAKPQTGTSRPKLTMKLPLEKRVCRLYFDPIRPEEVGVKRRPFYGLTPEQIVDIVADMGTEMWATGVTMGGKGVWFPSKMVAQSNEVPAEHLARVVKRAHEHGIWVQGCQQLSDVENQDLEGKMAEWAIHPLDDGRGLGPNKQYQSFAAPGFRDWMGRHMVEHVAIGGLDGLWFDGTPFAQRVGWPWAVGDVGPYGRESFKRKTGHEPPTKIDFKDPVFREWVKWRYDTTVEFMQAVTLRAAQENPNVAVAMVYNMHNVDWHLGLPMRNLSKMKWYPAIHDETSLLGRIGRALSPRSEQWFWAEWYMPNLVHGESPYYNPDRTITKGLRALAHGTYPSIGGFSADIELWQDSMKKVFTELKKRRDYVGGETIKYAALVVSEQTRDYRREPENFWRSVEGFNEIQNAANLLTDVIFDDGLTPEGLAPYPLVILPNTSCLSDKQCEALRDYVRKGGTLIATMESSLYDEWGNRRENFGLADLFGVDYVGQGYSTQILVPETPALRKQFGRFVCFESPSMNVRLRKDANVAVLFTRCNRPNLNGLSVKFEDYTSDVPEVVKRRYGKGTVVYLTTDVGHGYMSRRLPQLAEMVATLERTSARPPLSFRAPGVVETTGVWRGEKRMAVHLVNCTSLHLGTTAPLADIGITVVKGKLKRATLPLHGKTLPVQGNSVTIPSVRYGEVVVLELQ